MSRESSAAICADATGVDYRTCLEWRKSNRIGRKQPIPDARSAAQRSFEAHLAFRLAIGLCDRQIDGAVLGVVKSVPSADHLELELHPQMAKRALLVLLPSYYSEQDYYDGVPGLRREPDADTLVLRDIPTNSQVRVSGLPVGVIRSALLAGARKGVARQDTILLKKEMRQRARWSKAARGEEERQVVARDWLLSRLLRRPVLLGEIGAAHGWVNSYAHNVNDVVLEWCCGPDPQIISRNSREVDLRHGLGVPSIANSSIGVAIPTAATSARG